MTTYRVLTDLQKLMKIHLLVIDNEGNVAIEPPLNGPEYAPKESTSDDH